MKKLLPLLALVIIAGAVFYFITSTTTLPTTTSSTSSSGSPGGASTSSSSSESSGVTTTGGTVTAAKGVGVPGSPNEDGEEIDRKATELYKTPEEALKAINAGAADYDDRILEQFTEVGEDCSWCDAVYAELAKSILAPETSQDKRSYYAELLAVSGKVSNVQTLVEAIKAAPNQETADALSEALELTLGKNDVTQYLGEQIATSNDDLKESLIAAVTNQGTRLAVDILYKTTTQKGDPDGYYALGIGLAELVPDEEAMPYLQELALKRDQYSHLAVKSLLNNGTEGLKLVMSTIANSPNPEFDAGMLKNAVDHVPFDDDTKEYLQNIVDKDKDPLKVKFAKEILDAAKADEAGSEEDDAAAPADEVQSSAAAQ